MLRDLHIRNFALIDDLRMSFGGGLNVLTGETGAGKSIVIDALGYVLGDRANAADVMRTGSDRALVDAVFEVESESTLHEKLLEHGLVEDEGSLLMSRELSGASGKSQCRVNGRLVPVSVLREIGDLLVDVHGQHEHQSLLVPERHVDILDSWVGRPALDSRAEVAAAVSRAAQLRRDLEELRASARERVRTMDLYRYQLDEIAIACPVPGEEEILSADQARLSNAARLRGISEEVYHLLSADGGRGAVDQMQSALSSVEHGANLDDALTPVLEGLREAVSFAEDASRSIRRYQDGIEISPDRLEEIVNRLDLLKGLRRKYGESLQDVLAYAQDIEGRLAGLENSEAREAELTDALSSSEREVDAAAELLTGVRRNAAVRFAAQIQEQLKDLGMGTVRFEASLISQAVNARGAERVELMISANPGEPLRPLARIASGGEMSRVMLAIKSVAAEGSGVPTMVFDEIDAGVGGRTANVLGDKLAALGARAQILCITHLPQVASRAADHFLIEKSVSADRTSVSICHLNSEARVSEIVRMLGGAAASDAVVRHAREMLSVLSRSPQ